MNWFRRKSLGFGSAGIRRQRICGAVLIMPSALAALQLGIETVETAVNLTRFSVRYFLEINTRLPDNKGETRGRARSDKFSREIDLEGELTAATGGPMSFTIAAACTLANDIDDFGLAQGIVLLDEATMTQSRGEFRTVSMRLSSNPGLTSV